MCDFILACGGAKVYNSLFRDEAMKMRAIPSLVTLIAVWMPVDSQAAGGSWFFAKILPPIALRASIAAAPHAPGRLAGSLSEPRLD